MIIELTKEMENPIFQSPDFINFLKPGTNRKEYLCNLLEKLGIDFSVIPLDGKNHIYIKFPHHAYNPMFRIKTLLVHYDIFEGSPGANDNSAAVFQVINWIRKNSLEQHNMRIFFTDGEELGKDSENQQGSFALAQIFKRLGIIDDDIFVLDGCGRGEVLVVSTAGKNSNIEKNGLKNGNFKNRFNELYEHTINLAKSVANQSWITAPVPYGDNAGFIAQGIPAVALTVLPKEEATEYLRNLQKHKDLAKKIMNHQELVLPKTWKIMHTEQDNIDSLSQNAFILMEKFLETLAKSRQPL